MAIEKKSLIQSRAAAKKAIIASQGGVTPSLTKPNLTKPNLT